MELDQETNPWTSAEARFDEAAARLKLDDGICKVLKTSVTGIPSCSALVRSMSANSCGTLTWKLENRPPISGAFAAAA